MTLKAEPQPVSPELDAMLRKVEERTATERRRQPLPFVIVEHAGMPDDVLLAVPERSPNETDEEHLRRCVAITGLRK